MAMLLNSTKSCNRVLNVINISVKLKTMNWAGNITLNKITQALTTKTVQP